MYVVFDIETSGLDSMRDDIIQFAYIAFHNGVKVRSDILYFYHEKMTWNEEAFNVHHISKEFLQQYEMDFDKNLVKMFTVLCGADVVGFNSDKFDCPFVQHWLARMGIPGLTYRTQTDIMKAFRPVTKQAFISLVKLSEKMNLTREAIASMAQKWFSEEAGSQAHDAAYDVAATAMLTMIGIGKKLITFDDTASVVSEPEVDTRPRDPKGLLVYLNTTPYIINTDKSQYSEGLPTGDEIEDYTNRCKIIKVPFTWSAEHNAWEIGPTRLIIGNDKDSLLSVKADGTTQTVL